MFPFLTHIRAAALAGLAALAISACGGTTDPTVPPPPPPPAPVDPGPDLTFGQVVWTDSADVPVAWSHCDHWHGTIRVRPGQTRTLKLWFIPSCLPAHDAPEREHWFSLEGVPAYDVRIEVDDPTIIAYDGDRHLIKVIGRRLGTTRTRISVRRNGAQVYLDPAYYSAVQQ